MLLHSSDNELDMRLLALTPFVFAKPGTPYLKLIPACAPNNLISKGRARVSKA